MNKMSKMSKINKINKGIVILLITLIFSIFSAKIYADPLPSWQDKTAKKNIIAFVEAVTTPNSPDFVPPKNRIATFDNDGTLWVEQPLYTQEIFMLSRFKTLAKNHPEWQKNPDFKAILNNNFKSLTPHTLETIFALTSTNMSVTDYNTLVTHWLAEAKSPRFHKHYTALVYQPMLDVIRYLQHNHFKVYIVSGGEQNFVRAFSEEIYNIPIDKVIGTTVKTEYNDQDHKPYLLKLAKPLFISNFKGKPEAIDLFIGKKPIIAFGNSDGDREMLEWTASSKGKTLMLLVHHDDAVREYAYDTKSKVGTFSLDLMKEAKENHWVIISMKNDWKVMFP